MNEQIERIKVKLEQLKKLDRNLTLFGSQKHKYKLNATVSLDTINQFESTYKIKLPNEYVHFLINIGNGGAGPFYGLEPLENVLFADLDYKRADLLLNPTIPFLHTEPWNLEFLSTADEEENEDEYEKQRQEFKEIYFDKEQMNGVIAICNYGCAISINLVVNGHEYGNIWTDDRASDNGIYPSYELGNNDKTTFLNWYELWLDNSLAEITRNPSIADTGTISNKQIAKAGKKSWWKFW